MNLQALAKLWNLTQHHPGTSGARVAARVLLGLYHGGRFPVDLTDLRLLDDEHLAAAIEVIKADATLCRMEVHAWLDHASGRRDFGARFEHLAHEYRVKGRCPASALHPVEPARLVVRAPAMAS